MWAPEDADEAGRGVGGGEGGGGEGGGESGGSKGSGGRDAGGDERLSVLRMLEAGKITAADAVRLLEALEAGAGPGHGPGRRAAASAAGAAGAASADEPRLIRVRMNDLRTGRPRLNLNVPFGLLGLVVDVAERFAARSGAGAGAEEISAARVLAELRSGVRGKVVDIEDEEHAVHLEVFVD